MVIPAAAISIGNSHLSSKKRNSSGISKRLVGASSINDSVTMPQANPMRRAVRILDLFSCLSFSMHSLIPSTEEILLFSSSMKFSPSGSDGLLSLKYFSNLSSLIANVFFQVISPH